MIKWTFPVEENHISKNLDIGSDDDQFRNRHSTFINPIKWWVSSSNQFLLIISFLTTPGTGCSFIISVIIIVIPVQIFFIAVGDNFWCK